MEMDESKEWEENVRHRLEKFRSSKVLATPVGFLRI